jgi:predicted transcriptional regulator
MTKLLDEAVAKVRALPDADQDEAAELLLSVVASHGDIEPLDEATLAAIEEGREQAARGEFASDEEMDAFFARHGVKPHRR